MSEAYKPHGYQKHAIKFVLNHGSAGLFLDPGLGKTSIILASFKELQRQHIVKKMLVIAPLRPAWSVWPGEVEKWTDFTDLSVAVLHGPKKDEILQRVNSGANEPDICVINPEGLEWLSRKINMKSFPFDMLVVDESTRFKHANTQRFKTLKPLLPRFRRRYILTGSPAPNGLLDLFGQIFILDGGAALGQYISHYRMHYFDPTGFGGYNWVPRAGAEEAIYSRLKPLVLRMSAADYLDLPPYIPNTIKIDLPEKAQKVYDQMESMLVATVEDDVVTAANIGAATGKCRQIANGGVYTSSPDATKKTWADVHEAKLDAVEEIVEELQGKPALIAYEFDHDLDRLRRRFGEDVPYIGGGVPQSRFREIEKEWNEGKIPILLAQPQSVAHGLNLQGTGAAVIWHSLTWDLENYEQLIRRIWRQGQKERVVVHHIVARGTIDEVIMRTAAAGGKKDRTQQALLEALKSHLKGRKAA
jgi:SNF2 family DNA or RNA helicase